MNALARNRSRRHRRLAARWERRSWCGACGAVLMRRGEEWRAVDSLGGALCLATNPRIGHEPAWTPAATA